MGPLAHSEKCVCWLLLRPMCHRLDNSLSSCPFTVISTTPPPVIHQSRGSQKEYEIKKEKKKFVYIHVLISLREEKRIYYTKHTVGRVRGRQDNNWHN